MVKTNFSSFLTKFYFFGTPVNLTVNGKSKFKTKLGSFLSLTLTLGFLLYATLSAFTLVTRRETRFYQNFITNYYS